VAHEAGNSIGEEEGEVPGLNSTILSSQDPEEKKGRKKERERRSTRKSLRGTFTREKGKSVGERERRKREGRCVEFLFRL